jgi:LacI family transcriptional regulator
VPHDPQLLSTAADGQRETARASAAVLLGTSFERGTGVIAPNDAAGEAFMEAAEQHGLIAGRDYGIVGFDDQARETGLTSLRPPLQALGEEAARIVVRLLRGQNAPARVALHHQIMPRASTRPSDANGNGRSAEEQERHRADGRTVNGTNV